jgi:hypothetical protein
MREIDMVAQIIRGSTIRNIAEVPRIAIGQPPTSMAALLAEMPWGRDKILPGRTSARLEQVRSGTEIALLMRADRA